MTVFIMTMGCWFQYLGRILKFPFSGHKGPFGFMAIGREMYITKQGSGDRFMTVKIKRNFQEKVICMEEEYSEKKRTMECSSSKAFGTGNI